MRNCNWKSWILPGLVVVALLTILTTYFKIGPIETSLTSQTSQALSGDYPWASVETSGRDVTVRGISPSQEAKANAINAAAQIYGVRVARDGAAFLEFASPYVFKATKQDGSIVLSGNALNSGMRARVIESAERANPNSKILDELVEARGSPAQFSRNGRICA